MSFFKRKSEVDMTSGSIIYHLLVFAFPLLIGNIFQQFYNTVDTWVVGNYVGNEAFAAVGSVGVIINVLIGLFNGFSNGATVVISQYFGAKQYDKVQKSVHTTIIITVFMGIAFTVVGILMTPAMLKLTDTDPDVIPYAKQYLEIYFAGILSLILYNIGSGILRAVGDSTRPFIFLVISAILNIALDLYFVIALDMKVVGVALATVISQTVSVILILITLIRSDSCIKFSFKKLSIDKIILKKIVKISIPASIQLALTQFSNVFVQSYINGFGKDYMSAWTAYSKIDQLILLPMQSISIASSTFVGQNLGKQQDKRARKGISTAMLLSVISTAVLMIPVLIFSPTLVTIFNKTPRVVEVGALLLRYITPFYILCCVNQILAGALRGSGNTKAPMIILLSSFVFFRQVYLFVISRVFVNNFLAIAMGYPAGWLMASLLMFIYYKNADLNKYSVTNTSK